MIEVIHKVNGSTLLVEINRPHRANALRRRTIHQLEAQLDAAEASESGPTTLPDNRISVLVVTGSSKRFSADTH
ncbi:MAG: hypothetical protein J4G00_00440 [Actinomycetia bacterium]|nr:hypothetical protein [Actinomycetes bacterium]